RRGSLQFTLSRYDYDRARAHSRSASDRAHDRDIEKARSYQGKVNRTDMSTPAIGTAAGHLAPDFELKDGNNEAWRLSKHRGKVVALVFYPRDETPVCTKQMCSMRDRWADYQTTGAEVVAISVASVESHRKFAEHHDLPQRLLA